MIWHLRNKYGKDIKFTNLYTNGTDEWQTNRIVLIDNGFDKAH